MQWKKKVEKSGLIGTGLITWAKHPQCFPSIKNFWYLNFVTSIDVLLSDQMNFSSFDRPVIAA